MRALRAFRVTALFAFVVGALGVSPAVAAEFGLTELQVSSTAKNRSPAVQAGSHPYELTTNLVLKTEESPLGSGEIVPVGSAKDANIAFPQGFAGNPTAVPRCTTVQFLSENAKECPDTSAVGIGRIEVVEAGGFSTVPVYNLYPAPGSAGKLGFNVEGLAPVVVDLTLNPNSPYNVIVKTTNISQGSLFFSAQITIWGVPAAASHDTERGRCALNNATCEFSGPKKPFITLPTSCAAPLSFHFEADSWQNPSPLGVPYPFQESVTIHDNSVPPNDLSPAGCAKLEFAPQIVAQPTNSSADSPTGLDFDLDVEDEGISNPSEEATAASTIKKAVVTLPEGMTINPSQAEGLGVCSEAQLEAEKADSQPGEGCPQSSKIGNVEVESPLLEGEVLKGGLFVATPYHNPFGSLIALYMVFRDPALGIIVRQPGKVEPDPSTGQLIATFGEAPYEIPQLPFSHFHLHFREGGRSPLATPPTCGTYTTRAVFTPWARPESSYATTSSFQVTSGTSGRPCPPAGIPPFHPGFEAGSINNAAGSYSPVYMRLTREDGEQGMTKFSSVFPPGLVGKIAGVAKCPDAAIEAAKSKTGLEELASPSCPSSSQVGRVLAGAGVGPSSPMSAARSTSPAPTTARRSRLR